MGQSRDHQVSTASEKDQCSREMTGLLVVMVSRKREKEVVIRKVADQDLEVDLTLVLVMREESREESKVTLREMMSKLIYRVVEKWE